MRDFPIFTTEFGVASLVLREIPYKKEAYICIRDVQEGFLREHLCECVSFCKMAGADRVYATGADGLAAYPLADCIVQMAGEAPQDGEEMANLFPVTEQTVARFREIYNGKMRPVFNSKTLESRDEKEILRSGGAYFVHREGQLLGIGWVGEGEILALAAWERGAGEQVLRTLLSLNPMERVTLQVAASNQRAIRLYEKLGFLRTREVARWYDVT